MTRAALTLGALCGSGGVASFRVWAPKACRVEVRVVGPRERCFGLAAEADGYYAATVEDIAPGSDYFFRLDGGNEYPDPASRWQPEGVHGPSRVVDLVGERSGKWGGVELRRAVIYELHVGTFTAEGTFAAAAARLGVLRDLGITVIELMPVAQFAGRRNWGYDGVYPFAVQDSYGGPDGLREFVRVAHGVGLAVVLDVVYNHLGPEGNYLGQYGHYFTDRYRTPWGGALNFDGPYSDEVRRFFIENAFQWQIWYELDGLRLDAVHAIRDFSAVPFLEELGEMTREQARELGRPFHLIAESDLNMARHILPRSAGGYGLDGQWSDDFHHAVHVLLTGERTGYYVDYGGVGWLAKVWREGYGYTGAYSVHRKHRHGSSAGLTQVKQFVVCVQNHDQIGNRMLGDRLAALLSPEERRLGAATLLFSPFIPLLFMGEEYGETAPFQYFVSHADPALVEAVRAGRREEFIAFAWQGQAPDPQDEATYACSKINWELRDREGHRELLEFHRECLRLRAALPALAQVEKESQSVLAWEEEQVLMARCWTPEDTVVILLHFGREGLELDLPLPVGSWRRVLDSHDRRWGGTGSQWPELIQSEGGGRVVLRGRQALVLWRVEGGGSH